MRESLVFFFLFFFKGKLSESKNSGPGFVKKTQRTGGVYEITRKKLAGL
jgi:hypothetical protein